MKKQLFLVSLFAVFMTATEHAKASPVSEAEKKALIIERSMPRALTVEHFAALNATVSPIPFENYWHPLLNVASGKNFSDAEKSAAIQDAIHDTWQSTGSFTPGILSPHVIMMTLFTRAAGRDPNQGFISEEEAMQMYRETEIKTIENFWADGTHRSLRYAADGKTGDASYDPGHPGPNDPHENVAKDDILMWKGIPLLRWACLNPILTIRTQNPPPVQNPPPSDNPGFVPKRTDGINNSNTVATNIYLTIPASQQSGQVNYVPAPEKKQSVWGYVAAAVVGAIVGVLVDRNTGQYYQYDPSYPYDNNRYQPMPREWVYQRGGDQFVRSLPRYNTSQLNPILGTNQGGSPNNYRQGGSRNQQYYYGSLDGSSGGTRGISYGTIRG